jgi:hypothetical protein
MSLTALFHTLSVHHSHIALPSNATYINPQEIKMKHFVIGTEPYVDDPLYYNVVYIH